MKIMKALTIQIGIFGRTNAGKSTLMNFITGQDASIVSDVPGTTTDAVYKQMELNPLGPVTFTDTAGIDDASSLADARIEKTRRALGASDAAFLVCEAGKFGDFEKNIVNEAGKNNTPVIIIIGKTDIVAPEDTFAESLKKYSKNIMLFSKKNTNRDAFLNDFKRILVEILPDDFIENHSVLKNVILKDSVVVLVVPVDLGAPRGRLIMPQVQTIRNILDFNALSFIVKNTEYENALKKLKTPPSLVVTDSQVVQEVVLKTPKNVKLATFSTIFAAEKSDIVEMAKGAAALNNLEDGDKVLIAEACTHHASSDDIGRIKIPKWLKEYTGKNIQTDISSGQDYPENLRQYKLIIHCGACTLNRKAMLSRLNKAIGSGIPVTNYGIAISVFQGVIEKVLEIFPQALSAYKKEISAK